MTIQFQPFLSLFIEELDILIRIVRTVSTFMPPHHLSPQQGTSCNIFSLPFPFYSSYYDGSRQDVTCWRYPTFHHQSQNQSNRCQLPSILHAELKSETSGFLLYSSIYKAEKYHRYLRLHHLQLFICVYCIGLHDPPLDYLRTSCIFPSCNNCLQY